jgi:hypothetical protein
MRAIHPIHMGSTGLDVSNLHKALLFIFFHESITPGTGEALRQRLASDMRTETYGDATTELVGIWQGQLKNWPNTSPPLPPGLALKVKNSLPISTTTGQGNGDVDELTAETLNWFLRKLGALH